jgi:uncharacterized protein (DUF305 family)
MCFRDVSIHKGITSNRYSKEHPFYEGIKKEVFNVNKRFLFPLLISLLAIFVLAACGSTSSTSFSSGTPNTMPSNMPGMSTGTPMSDAMTDSLKGLSGKDFEVKFMQEMIAHHQSALEMATLVPTHTKRPELNTLAQNIISTQTKEIGQMTTWLAQWYNEKPLANSMDAPGMMDMMGGIDKMKNAKDTEFDKLFLDQMTMHHQQAVNMAGLVPQKAQHPELITLSKNIIQAQTGEIQQMKTWKQQWFNA